MELTFIAQLHLVVQFLLRAGFIKWLVCCYLNVHMLVLLRNLNVEGLPLLPKYPIIRFSDAFKLRERERERDRKLERED